LKKKEKKVAVVKISYYNLSKEKLNSCRPQGKKEERREGTAR
jgi:hypothetical protein